MSKHLVIIHGNLGKEPEMKYLASGTAITHCSIATNRTYTANGQTVKETIWWNLSVWGKQGEAVNQYMHKGSSAMVIGEMRPDKDGNPRIWTGSDQKPHASYEISVSSFDFCSKGGVHVEGTQEGEEPTEEAPSGDIPF